MPSHAAVRPGLNDLYRYRGRHRKQPESSSGSAARHVAVTAGIVAAIISGDVSSVHALPAGTPGEDAWHRLRMCESGENYRINTGNGYYGAYQFNLGTWRSVGGTGLPSDASATEQDYRARKLYRSRGWSPWGCARILGLKDDPIYGVWVAPITIRATDQFTVGDTVTVSGTAMAGAWVRVYGRAHSDPDFRTIANVRANANGQWSWSGRPTDDTYFAAASGGERSATVLARAHFPVTMRAPESVALGANYTLSGTARPGSVVRVYVKPFYYRGWLGTRSVRADATGRWSTVWRGSTDFVFAPRGATAGAATVRVRTDADASVKPVRNRTGADTAVAATRGAMHGTARPNTALMVYTRAVGAQQWRPYRLLRSDAAGRWSVGFTTVRDFEYQARAANGQVSAVERFSLS